MLQFFTPVHKVQKDRKLMHDTDSRIAKYSRRGLILNFLVFALCLYYGNFFQAEQGLAIFLVTGLLLVTLLRCYFLFRFEAHYARAPGRWRNQYFLVSFLGALWWSLILASLTWVLGMRDETLIMWLYSVVFYSSVANVFAPYRRFLSYYLFIGQIPAAATAILVGFREGAVDGYLYGTIMLMFYYMLNHQGKITEKAYWQRLEANYALRERAKGLEDERLDSQAAINVKNEFLSNLGREFRTSLNDILGSLSLIDNDKLSEDQRELLRLAVKAGERQLDLVNNVADYAKISEHELLLDQVVFNLRRSLEIMVEDLAVEAGQQGVEVHYVFDPDMPARVRGDATRMSQILGNLLGHVIHFSEMGQVVLEASYVRDTESAGLLQVIIRDEGRRYSSPEGDKGLAADNDLNLAICKALAECMGGGVAVTSDSRGQEIAIELRLEVSGKQTQQLISNPKMLEKRILLVDEPKQTITPVRAELERWGMKVVLAEAATAKQLLLSQSESDEAFDVVLLHGSSRLADTFGLSAALVQDPKLSQLKQVLALNPNQDDFGLRQSHLNSYPDIHIISRPVARQALYDSVNALLFDIDIHSSSIAKAGMEVFGRGQRILLVDDHRVNQMVAEGMLKKLGYSVVLASNGREAAELWQQQSFALVLMDCQMPEMDGYQATREIRRLESEASDNEHIPIVAMTAHAAEGNQARCLGAGMDDYLVKPVRLGELQLRLKRWLGVSES
tara:strand:- start:3080 stop:5275 length:2196 start_codon:yes stop_codon:yes gene_type:complete